MFYIYEHLNLWFSFLSTNHWVGPFKSKQGGFAYCYKLTDIRTKKLFAGKIVSKATLTKHRAKEKVCSPLLIVWLFYEEVNVGPLSSVCVFCLVFIYFIFCFLFCLFLGNFSANYLFSFSFDHWFLIIVHPKASYQFAIFKNTSFFFFSFYFSSMILPLCWKIVFLSNFETSQLPSHFE